MAINYDIGKLHAAIKRFPEVKVLVVGDVMMDEFIWGTVTRISPEAPVPVVDVIRETRLLGGAANVINNIVSAGGGALLAGVVGADAPGREVCRMLEDAGVGAQGIMVDHDRPTTIKTRVVAHGQQVVRFDREKRLALSREVAHKLNHFVDQAGEEVHGVIISDYGKGVVTKGLMDQVRRVFKTGDRVVAVDPKVNNFKLYRNVTVLTPNHHEAAQGARMVVESGEDIQKAGQKILEELDCISVLITRGEQGMTLFEQGGNIQNIPTVAQEVFDVTGAGDTVIAILTMGLAAGLSLTEAAILANFAAGIVVGEVGTSAVTADELMERVSRGAKGVNGLVS